jgi:hypothetical protein
MRNTSEYHDRNNQGNFGKASYDSFIGRNRIIYRKDENPMWKSYPDIYEYSWNFDVDPLPQQGPLTSWSLDHSSFEPNYLFDLFLEPFKQIHRSPFSPLEQAFNKFCARVLFPWCSSLCSDMIYLSIFSRFWDSCEQILLGSLSSWTSGL